MRILYTVLMALVLAAGVHAAEAGAPAIPNRAGLIKPGEWVLMRHITPGGAEETSKATVTAVEGGTVTLTHEVFGADGEVLESNERTMNAAEMGARVDAIAKSAGSVTAETLMVKDAEIPVVVVNWTGNGQEFKAWISPDIPVTGLAKFWTSDANIPGAEIIDYGFGND